MKTRYKTSTEMAATYACFADFYVLPLNVHVLAEVGGFAGASAHVGAASLSQRRVESIGASPTAVGLGLGDAALEDVRRAAMVIAVQRVFLQMQP